MTTRWIAVVRGTVAAIVAVFVAAFSHVIGGGTTPGAAGLTSALVLAAFASILLAGRRMSRLRLSLSVIISQLAFHLLFAVGSTAAAPVVPVAPAAGMQGMAGMLGVPGMTVPASAALVPPGAAMWLAHAIAAVVTIVVLGWGEKALQRMLEAARLAFARLLSVPAAHPDSPRPLRPAVFPEPRRPRARVLVAGPRHRGPPALAASSR